MDGHTTVINFQAIYRTTLSYTLVVTDCFVVSEETKSNEEAEE